MKKGFSVVLLAYTVATVIILIILPLNRFWFITAGILYLFACFLQSIWNKYFKNTSTKKGLKQAEDIHAGKIEGKTFDEFLDEI